MLKTIAYDRASAIQYAETWALSRNPQYYNFDPIGGDCTNFISQCLFAGSGIMNETPITGWYYHGLNRRSAAWTGVEYLARFLLTNDGPGPRAKEVPISALRPGDIVQLGTDNGHFYHSLLVLSNPGPPFVAAHTDDSIYRPLSDYLFGLARGLHITEVGLP